MNDKGSLAGDLYQLGHILGDWAMSGIGALRQGFRDGARARVQAELQLVQNEMEEEYLDSEQPVPSLHPQHQPPGTNHRLPLHQANGYLPPPNGEQQPRQKRPYRRRAQPGIPQQPPPQLPGGQS
jgi:hypothetical protein